MKAYSSKKFEKNSRRSFILSTSAVIGTAATLGAQPAFAQLGDLGSALGKLNRVPGFNLSTLTQGTPPISTTLADAKWADPSRDNYNPARYLPLTGLRRGANGTFFLAQGCYEFHAQSYCFHAGTYGPGGGDGYIYAPTLGSQAPIITQIRQNSFNHQDIAQSDIQSLIWAILARAKFETLNNNLKAVALQLLTRDQLVRLNRNALDLVPQPVLNRALAEAPPALRQALEAEARMRSLLSSANSSYQSLERIAILSGNAPMGAGSISIPANRWSAHPDGYLIRFKPSGYSHTLVQICVEPRSIAIGKELDLCTHIAVPGNTSRQRLGCSNREKRA